jgi:hypothetical protein
MLEKSKRERIIALVNKELPVKYRYHVKTALGNYLFIKAKSYDEAQQVIDSIYSKGLYKVSCSVL